MVVSELSPSDKSVCWLIGIWLMLVLMEKLRRGLSSTLSTLKLQWLLISVLIKLIRFYLILVPKHSCYCSFFLSKIIFPFVFNVVRCVRLYTLVHLFLCLLLFLTSTRSRVFTVLILDFNFWSEYFFICCLHVWSICFTSSNRVFWAWDGGGAGTLSLIGQLNISWAGGWPLSGWGVFLQFKRNLSNSLCQSLSSVNEVWMHFFELLHLVIGSWMVKGDSTMFDIEFFE